MLREGQSRQRQGLKQGVPACFTAGYEGSSHGMCGTRAAELGAIVTKGLSVGLRQGQGQGQLSSEREIVGGRPFMGYEGSSLRPRTLPQTAANLRPNKLQFYSFSSSVSFITHGVASGATHLRSLSTDTRQSSESSVLIQSRVRVIGAC